MQEQIEFQTAKNTKYPEPIVFAIAKDSSGTANPMTIGWSCTVSGTPPMFAIALAHKRYTAQAIRHSKCFTLVFPSSDMAEEAMFFGTKSGRDIDKFAEFGSNIEPAKQIDSVLMTDAVANFECVLEGEFNAGDHVVFVGKVVASHVNTEPKKRLYTIGSGYKLGSVSSRKQKSGKKTT